VPNINIRIEAIRAIPVTSPLQKVGEVWIRRLLVKVRLGTRADTLDAVLDTGAPLSILSKDLWETCDQSGDISWVQYPPSESIPKGTSVSLMGGLYPYRLGLIEVTPIDNEGKQLLKREVLVQCLEANIHPTANARPVINLAIMGLTHGICDRRYLVVNSSPLNEAGTAWLQDERPVEPSLPRVVGSIAGYHYYDRHSRRCDCETSH